MLRIERILNGSETVLRAAGRLTGPWVAELSRTMADEAGAGVLVRQRHAWFSAAALF